MIKHEIRGHAAFITIGYNGPNAALDHAALLRRKPCRVEHDRGDPFLDPRHRDTARADKIAAPQRIVDRRQGRLQTLAILAHSRGDKRGGAAWHCFSAKAYL